MKPTNYKQGQLEDYIENTEYGTSEKELLARAKEETLTLEELKRNLAT